MRVRPKFGKAVRAALLFGALALAAGSAGAQETATVRVGVLHILSDAPLVVADKKGFFRQEGLNVVFTQFDSAANMVAPLGTDQLDVGAGAPTAGVFNAYGRGLNLRIVADKASNPPGYGFDKLLIRAELVQSGRYKKPSDLKGMTLGENASVISPALIELLRKYNLKPDDVMRVNLNYSEQVAALQNGKVDATITTEPLETLAVRRGIAKNVLSGDTWYPYQEIAVLIYGGDFIKNHRDLALKFMRAYIKGARFYYGALKDGRFGGPNAGEVVALLMDYTGVRDPSLYANITPSYVDPDGKLAVAALRKDLGIFRDEGLIQGRFRADDMVDTTFADAVVKELGPYKRR